MTDREPVEVTNLDRYGFPALPWSRPRDLLAAAGYGPLRILSTSSSAMSQAW
jgi:hypothetical protein